MRTNPDNTADALQENVLIAAMYIRNSEAKLTQSPLTLDQGTQIGNALWAMGYRKVAEDTWS